uniref:Ig-like domain-containing protein n=1 Tax=Oryzias sinensis TaxID=183150 RepID=A0A8C7WWI6_9TELE
NLTFITSFRINSCSFQIQKVLDLLTLETKSSEMLRGAECSLCSSPAGIQIIRKKPGDDVTLMCRDPEYMEDSSLLEWRRKDSKILFLFKDGRPFPYDTHESFRNRVFLKDSQVKDGDLSVVLKNVTMKDTGTYECRVIHENDPQRKLILISTIHLSVDLPEQGGLIAGGITGIVLAVLIPAAGLWIYRKKKGPKKSFSGSNNQQDPEQDFLNPDYDAESNTTDG